MDYQSNNKERKEKLLLLKDYSSSIKSFKQFQIQKNLNLPEKKPDIQCILRVSAKIEIMKKEFIYSPIGKSLEGQNLTGKILVVNGNLIQTIEYVACDVTQSVHSAHFILPFSTYIILEKEFEKESKNEVIAIVEDTYAKLISKRKICLSNFIFINVTNTDLI